MRFFAQPAGSVYMTGSTARSAAMPAVPGGMVRGGCLAVLVVAFSVAVASRKLGLRQNHHFRPARLKR